MFNSLVLCAVTQLGNIQSFNIVKYYYELRHETFKIEFMKTKSQKIGIIFNIENGKNVLFYMFRGSTQKRMPPLKILIPTQQSMIDNYLNISINTDIRYNSSLELTTPRFCHFIIYSNSQFYDTHQILIVSKLRHKLTPTHRWTCDRQCTSWLT